MKITITIECNNAAFEPRPGREAGRILKELAEKMLEQNLFNFDNAKLRDVNGNTIGKVQVSVY